MQSIYQCQWGQAKTGQRSDPWITSNTGGIIFWLRGIWDLLDISPETMRMKDYGIDNDKKSHNNAYFMKLTRNYSY